MINKEFKKLRKGSTFCERYMFGGRVTPPCVYTVVEKHGKEGYLIAVDAFGDEYKYNSYEFIDNYNETDY